MLLSAFSGVVKKLKTKVPVTAVSATELSGVPGVLDLKKGESSSQKDLIDNLYYCQLKKFNFVFLMSSMFLT